MVKEKRCAFMHSLNKIEIFIRKSGLSQNTFSAGKVIISVQSCQYDLTRAINQNMINKGILIVSSFWKANSLKQSGIKQLIADRRLLQCFKSLLIRPYSWFCRRTIKRFLRAVLIYTHHIACSNFTAIFNCCAQ